MPDASFLQTFADAWNHSLDYESDGTCLMCWSNHMIRS